MKTKENKNNKNNLGPNFFGLQPKIVLQFHGLVAIREPPRMIKMGKALMNFVIFSRLFKQISRAKQKKCWGHGTMPPKYATG